VTPLAVRQTCLSLCCVGTRSGARTGLRPGRDTPSPINLALRRGQPVGARIDRTRRLEMPLRDNQGAAIEQALDQALIAAGDRNQALAGSRIVPASSSTR